ncbi:hypothetical protein GF371_03550 [Candidatus Woesearchaeota archaeon]|nr:hypothetical protein [Candidatus Woesearchaeota archaeon]
MWEMAKFLDELEDLKTILAGEEILESNLKRMQKAALMPSYGKLAGKILGFLGFSSVVPDGKPFVSDDVLGTDVLIRKVAGETQRVFIDYERQRLYSMTDLGIDLKKSGIPYNDYKTHFSFELKDIVSKFLLDEALNKPIYLNDF